MKLKCQSLHVPLFHGDLHEISFRKTVLNFSKHRISALHDPIHVEHTPWQSTFPDLFGNAHDDALQPIRTPGFFPENFAPKPSAHEVPRKAVPGLDLRHRPKKNDWRGRTRVTTLAIKHDLHGIRSWFFGEVQRIYSEWLSPNLKTIGCVGFFIWNFKVDMNIEPGWSLCVRVCVQVLVSCNSTPHWSAYLRERMTVCVGWCPASDGTVQSFLNRAIVTMSIRKT